MTERVGKFAGSQQNRGGWKSGTNGAWCGGGWRDAKESLVCSMQSLQKPQCMQPSSYPLSFKHHYASCKQNKTKMRKTEIFNQQFPASRSLEFKYLRLRPTRIRFFLTIIHCFGRRNKSQSEQHLLWEYFHKENNGIVSIDPLRNAAFSLANTAFCDISSPAQKHAFEAGDILNIFAANKSFVAKQFVPPETIFHLNKQKVS